MQQQRCAAERLGALRARLRLAAPQRPGRGPPAAAVRAWSGGGGGGGEVRG